MEKRKKNKVIIKVSDLSKSFNNNIVLKNINFKLIVSEPIKFDKDLTIEAITLQLNKILEKMILKNPDQWIWTHDRWKK